MDGPEIPPFFLCPISLQVMKDPVTVSTGVSYDRESIERWLTAYGHDTCPVTNQPLADRSLTPNATLLRLIQSWFADNNGRLANPCAGRVMPALDAINVAEIANNLGDASSPFCAKMRTLRRLKSLLTRKESNIGAACMAEDVRVIPLVASLIRTRPETSESLDLCDPSDMIEEAMTVLDLLKPSSEILKAIAEQEDGQLITSLCMILQKGSYQATVYAILLLSSIFKVVDDRFKARLPPNTFEWVVEILKDQNSSQKTMMALLLALVAVLPHGKNRLKAVEAGAVEVVVELLMEESMDRRKCEAMLYLLELMCGRAEGRAALVAHPAGVAAVAAKVLKMSTGVTDRAVKLLGLLCRHCGLVEEMMEVGGVAKVCMVVQVECSRKSKEMAKEILGMHLRSWSRFPCFPSNCLP